MTDKLTLYTVTVEFTFHVVATSLEQATQVAGDYAEEALREETDAISNVAESERIENNWEGALPYSAREINLDQLTVEQILRGDE